MTLVDTDQLRAKYQRQRSISGLLNEKLVNSLDKDVIQEGAKRLGFAGALRGMSEDDFSVLMDYCIYDVRRKGRNGIERYLIDNPPDDDSPEIPCLRAKQHATYGVVLVESVERGLGIHVRDLLSDDQRFIVDLGFGSIAAPRFLIATRLLAFDEFSMTGGAAIPLGVLPEDVQDEMIDCMSKLLVEDADGYVDPAPIIQLFLKVGRSSRTSQMRYEQPRRGPSPRQPDMAPSRIGRNDPCPCGSGKKFKQCCMRG